MLEVHRKIAANFKTVDKLLSRIEDHYFLFHTLFSIRTRYCVQVEFFKHAGKTNIWGYLKKIIKTGYVLCTIPFKQIEISNPHKIMILEGYLRFDRDLSQELEVDLISLRKQYTFSGFGGRLKVTMTGFYYSMLLLFSGLKLSNLIYCIPDLLSFLHYYYCVSMDKIELIIAENDIEAIPYAVLLKAKENNVIRVKTDYVQIDSVTHDNVFADYYFYPTTYHLNIRKKCIYNKQLKYIEGGYLTKGQTNININLLSSNHHSVITYFTGHGGLFEYPDSFYIEEILSLMPEKSSLNIKVHPYDDPKLYIDFLKDSRVRLITFDQMDNKTLIANSDICLSVFSVMSFEAKNVCANSYFINYGIEDSAYKKDYEYISDFFDIIADKDFLKLVISGQHVPVTIDTFRRNVNITYPRTFEMFKDFINNCMKDK